MIINQASAASSHIPHYTRTTIPNSADRISGPMPGVQITGVPVEASDQLDISGHNAIVRENLTASHSQQPAADVAAGLLQELKEQICGQGGKALDAQAGNLGAGLLKLLED